MEPLFTFGLFPVYSTAQPDFSQSALEAIPLAYVIDGDGWKLVKRNALAASQLGIKALEGMPKLEEEVRLLTAKIPLALLKRVTAFFQAVYKKQKSEAAGYLLYEAASQTWDFLVPPQSASSASAKYGPAPRREGWTVAGTIHSHASMSAFHSGTDHADEQNFDGVHITIGKVDGVSPEYSYSVVIDGKRASYNDAPHLMIEGMAESTFPDEWLDRVTEGLPTKWKGDKEAEALFQDYLGYRLTSVQLEAALDALDRRALQPTQQESKKDHSSGSGNFSFLDRRRFRHRGGNH